MAADPLIVLCTVPDEGIAEKIAEALVSEKLAACVNIVPGITSVYRWKGAIEHDRELLLIIKSAQDAYPALENRVRALHPYELPEVIAVPIGNGLPEYLDWITNSLKTIS
jgi:periplasmic divalent cation tolerance protein